MPTDSLTCRFNAKSYPSFVPSASILVNKISPAPLRSTSFTQSIRSFPVSFLPPWVKTRHWLSDVFFASTATTIHWFPNLSEASDISCGFNTAAVFKLTLSAPAFSIVRMSSRSLKPPPTVKGIKHSEAVRSTTSSMIFRSSLEAVISKNTSSSAPCFS